MRPGAGCERGERTTALQTIDPQDKTGFKDHFS